MHTNHLFLIKTSHETSRCQLTEIFIFSSSIKFLGYEIFKKEMGCV
jgi:hypothetical protein